MELKAEFTRETYRNYMIFYNQDDTSLEGNQKERYDVPMLLNNQIPYLLTVQITYLNQRARYAYDITGKQAVFDWVERRKIKYKDCVNLYSAIFDVIDTCSEYLLDESNLVLLPEYIYYELSNYRYHFLYHIYYHRDILQQVNELCEFLMDHVDYEDEKAVLLVYAMYHESKRKESSIDTLRTLFQEKKRLKESESPKSGEIDVNQSYNKESNIQVERSDNTADISDNTTERIDDRIIRNDNQVESNNLRRRQLVQRPIMEVREESERLVSKFPLHSYSVVGVTILVMLIVIVYSVSQGLELKKLVAVVLIVASITAYIGSKMFDPKKKVEKLVPVVEYIKQPVINPLTDQENIIKIDNFKESVVKEPFVKEVIQVESDDLSECTRLLSVIEECNDEKGILEDQYSGDGKSLCIQYVLTPEVTKYQQLRILEFPFYIGKITEGMDAVIMESTISRVHAKITREDGEFYITDMGSTNGTFINAVIIQPHTKMKVQIGDVLRFANLAYTFGVSD